MDNVEDVLVKEMDNIIVISKGLGFTGAPALSIGALVGNMIVQAMDENEKNKKFNYFQNQTLLLVSAEEAFKEIYELLKKWGNIINSEEGNDSTYSSITSMYKYSEALIRMVLFRVVVIPTGDSSCNVIMTGASREGGLFKARASEKVLSNISNSIRYLFNHRKKLSSL